jgi:hypothetical protein
MNQTFFQHGIPPLGQRLGSKSKGSVSKEKHEDATIEERTFGCLPDESLCKQDNNLLWLQYEVKGRRNDWGSESDIQGMVKQVLDMAIYTVGLQGELKCFNELSIFDLRPDIWVVCNGGVPIGVVEVKKPCEDEAPPALQNSYVQGQIFDYMLRLQSFFGLHNVFGILSCYDQWRICWMPGSDRAAQATSLGTGAQEEEVETQTVVPPREMCGSKVFAWNDRELPRVLCTTILKMYSSPRSVVHLIDKNRPYIKLDENMWYWGRIPIEDELKLHHSKLPSGNKFTLLADLREGADGRVWRACTDAGLGCCIKFPISQTGTDKLSYSEQLAQIEEEAENWHAAYGTDSARVVTLSGRPALVMRYLRPLELQDGELTEEDKGAVQTAIEKFAAKALKHDDLALRHLGILSPPKKGRKQEQGEPPEIVLFDMGRVSRERDCTVAVADMMSQLSLM